MHIRHFYGSRCFKILILITYDVNTTTKQGRKRLRKVAKECQNYGHRVQNSVFECVVDSAQFRKIEAHLIDIIDEDADSLRFYNLGKSYQTKVTHVGAKPSLNVDDVLVF